MSYGNTLASNTSWKQIGNTLPIHCQKISALALHLQYRLVTHWEYTGNTVTRNSNKDCNFFHIFTSDSALVIKLKKTGTSGNTLERNVFNFFKKIM